MFIISVAVTVHVTGFKKFHGLSENPTETIGRENLISLYQTLQSAIGGKDSEFSTSGKIFGYTLELIVVQQGLPLSIKLSMKPLFVVLMSWDGSPRLLFLLRRLPRPLQRWVTK
ncbi:hypothetical protein CMV_024554 [Castanea mollissima]|uniref:Uncharacterized protein n=1 Tax=Castanea mollissima TaxID=60419 RepID=A0A8J4QEM1_9ROSI|nr:hypothetical protein CMV_024554 [Castanea mollissima]